MRKSVGFIVSSWLLCQSLLVVQGPSNARADPPENSVEGTNRTSTVFQRII
jgi:hypothetical protein